MKTRRAVPTFTVAALAAAFAFTGCLGSDDGDGSEQAEGTQSVSQSASAGGGAVKANPDREPIVSRKGSIGGDPVVFDILELKRSGSTTVLTIRLRATGETSSAQIAGTFDDSIDQQGPAGTTSGLNTLDGINLIDTTNRKRYLVGRDTRGVCACDSELGGVFVEPGNGVELSATYAALPSGTNDVDIHVPEFGTFHDVPIS